MKKTIRHITPKPIISACMAAIIVLLSSSSGFASPPMPQKAATEHFRRGEQYYDAGVKDRAMEELRKGLSLAVKAHDRAGEAMLLNAIYKIYFYEKRLDGSAEELLNRSLDIYRELKDTANMINAYNNLALHAFSQGKGQKASRLFADALELCADDNDKKAVVLQNMAEMHLDKSPSTALRLLDQAASLSRPSIEKEGCNQEMIRSRFLILAKRAQIDIILGNISRATATVDSAAALTGCIERIRRPDALAHLSHICIETGDSIKAFRFMLGYEALMDSLTSENNENSLQKLLVQFDTERLQQRNEALKLKVQNRNNIVVSGTVIVLLLFALSAFLVWKMRSDRKRNRLIQRQQRDIAHYQKEAADLREREMRHELDFQNRQLTSFAINHSAINEFHSGLNAELARCRDMLADGDTKAAAKAIYECASRCRRFDEEVLSRDFRVYFEKVHPDFFSRLKSRFPVLTQNDLRLCAFLYLGMTTKEISALTYREVRSVESSRLRLRKKLEISGEVSLQSFLAEVTGSSDQLPL